MKRLKARVIRNIGTEQAWLQRNTVLGDGEVAYVRFGERVRTKIGNGTLAFSQLSYQDNDLKIAKVDTSFPFVSGEGPAPAGVYMASQTGTYQPGNVSVDVSGKMVMLIWDGVGVLDKVETELPSVPITDDLNPEDASTAVSSSGVSKIAYDESNYTKVGETQAESASTFGFESSTFSHWGTQVGVFNNFKAIKIKIRAWNASYIPTQIRVLIRTGINAGTILGDKTVDVTLQHNVATDVVVEFDTIITNPTNADLWVEYRTNGRVGLFKLTTASTRNAFYGTSANLSTGLTGASTSPNDRMWVEFLSTTPKLKFSDEAEELIKDLASQTDYAEIVLPSTLYALQGIESNIYFENIILSNQDLSNLDIDVTGSKGRHNEKRWTYTPTSADAGSANVTITVRDKSGNVLATKQSQLITVARSAGSGVTRNVNMWGDSNLASAQPLSIVNTELTGDVMTVNFRGTLGTGNARHEGRAGWRIYDYTVASQGGTANPLWIGGGLNYLSYLSNNSITIGSNDWVIIQLGTNDMFNASTDSAMNTSLDAAIVNMNKLITAFKAVSGVRIAICTSLPCAISQDAFGDDYGNGQRRDRFKRNIQMFAKRICDEYEGRTGESLYVIPTQSAIDPENGFPFSNINANSRSTTQIRTYTNAIHPNQSGYDQLGDVIFSFLKVNF